MINTIFEPDRSVASLTLAELENLIKDLVVKYNQSINLSNLTLEQIQQVRLIIQAFEAQNKLNNLANGEINDSQDAIDYLTENPVKVDGFLSRQEIYENSVMEPNAT